jgi:hypothetical protein
LDAKVPQQNTLVGIQTGMLVDVLVVVLVVVLVDVDVPLKRNLIIFVYLLYV